MIGSIESLIAYASPVKVAGLVLAAGAGTRLGTPKALLRLGGQTLAERAVGVLRGGGCSPVVAVAGAQPMALDGVTVVVNGEWATGMGSSLRGGLAALSEVDADAVVVVLVDMPGITAEAVRRVAALASPGALVMAGYGERRGHPVLFGRDHWAGIAESASGDIGARAYLRAHAAEVRIVGCDDVASDDDIDTAEDARRWDIPR
ncbi:MAG TPA: nucleotidyltransferase family protein [Candidatus Limnocylindrales bacterium]